MPRKNPVPEREKAICRRLREFRKSAKISQVLFAREVGLDSGQLRNYEHERAPVRYALARQLISRFSVNPQWLATGVGDMRATLKIPPSIDSEIPDWMLFSTAFDAVIGPRLGEFRNLVFGVKWPDDIGAWLSRLLPPLGTPSEMELPITTANVAAAFASSLPPHLKLEFFAAIVAAIHEFGRRFDNKIEGLDKFPKAGTIAREMKPGSHLQKLLDRVRKATAERGKKAELAETLRKAGHRVSRQRVTEWLAGDREPSADIALFLAKVFPE
jgi:transcriptional regulator with XRE-family HTH domain